MRTDWAKVLRRLSGAEGEEKLVAAFRASVPREFHFLVEEYGCVETYVEIPRRSRLAYQYTYHNGNVGAVISWDAYDGIRFHLVPVERGTLPRDDSGWAYTVGAPYLDSLVVLREPSSAIPIDDMRREQFTVEFIERVVHQYADVLRRHGGDMLRGEYSVDRLKRDFMHRRAQ